jgi:hypothetical protein
LVLLPAQQFPVNVGDLLQALFDLMIVLNPTADLFDLLGRHRAANPMRLVQGHTQIPYWSMALTAGAPAVQIAAGQIALHQGTPQNFAERGQNLGETLAAIPQGERGEFGEVLSFSHMTASIITPTAQKANTNLASANFLSI